jgi:hypothetical protein
MTMQHEPVGAHRFDPPEIHLDEEFETRYWSRILGLSRAELREAVRAAGTSNIYEVARQAGRPLPQ